MIYRLASGCHTVMASNTVGRNARVIETNDGRKRDGEVAALALVTSGRVINWLAGRYLVVMAIRACTIRFTVIHTFQRQETPRCMARIAAMSCNNMPSRFRCSSNDRALAMAVLAFAQCAGEIAAAMAIAASRSQMRPVKVKARRIVVKIRTDYRFRESGA